MKKYMSIEEVVALQDFQSARVSDDGRYVAFVRVTADWEANAYRNHLWIYETDSGEMYPLTTGQNESYSPEWSTDSTTLAFLQSTEKGSQICITTPGTDTKVQITNAETSISMFKWSPDGKGFYYISTLPEKEELQKRKARYGEMRFVGSDYPRNSISYIAITTKQVKAILHNATMYLKEFTISSDGSKILISATPTSDQEDSKKLDLFLLNTYNQAVEKLAISAIINGYLGFSPEGNRICYTCSIHERAYYEYRKNESIVEIYDLATGKKTRPLPECDSSLKPIRWIQEGILVNWKHRLSYRIGLLTEEGNLKTLDEEEAFITQPWITMDGKHLAYVKSTSTEFTGVYLNGQMITQANPLIKERHMSKKELVCWTNCEGMELEGVISLPVDFDPQKKYPLLVRLGGAYLVRNLSKWYPVEQFVEKGFIVFEPMKRGYYGYGNDFMKGDYCKLGIAYHEDVISGVDMLISRGFIDAARVGIMGFSEGGYTAVFSSLYSDRFAAAATYEGSADWKTLYASTAITYFLKQLLGATPWDNPEVYREVSALTYIHSAKTPTLIMHKDEEPIEPLVNAYELYKALRDKNVDTELVLFKDSGHFDEYPGSNVALMRLHLIWFAHYLLGESLEGFEQI